MGLQTLGLSLQAVPASQQGWRAQHSEGLGSAALQSHGSSHSAGHPHDAVATEGRHSAASVAAMIAITAYHVRLPFAAQDCCHNRPNARGPMNELHDSIPRQRCGETPLHAQISVQASLVTI